jgi:NADH-quinone oxidoreductase subunit M
MSSHLISLMVFFPILGALFQAFLSNPKSRWAALLASLLASVCAVGLVISMKTQTADLQASEIYPWVGSYAISYDMGIDGLNALMVLLVACLFPVLIASEWNQKTGARGMHGLFLILQTSLFGAVCAQDLFLQFFFWGMSALPFYFLVGIWGGKGRERAAFRSIVAASIGDAFVFAALILIYYSIEPHSFSLRELGGGKFIGKTFNFMGYALPVSESAFAMISAGLALRAPIWPLHGWFTEGAREAPSSVFVALCAGVVPISLYIFVRDCYALFPETLGDLSSVIVVVGTINLVMGGICAVSQRGLRKLLAFVCLSEVGLVLIGLGSLSPLGVVGAVYHQLLFGLGLAGFGLFSGIIADRTEGNTDFLDENDDKVFGGIVTQAPAISVVAGLITASLLGFPGLGGFVGHSLVIIGTYAAHPMAVTVAIGALILASYYLFAMYRSVFLGSQAEGAVVFLDLTYRERSYLFPIVFGLLFFGLYPKPLIELIRPTVLTLLSTLK